MPRDGRESEFPTTAAPPKERGDRAKRGEAISHGYSPVIIPINPKGAWED
jgi:hypothetical protein